MKFFALVMATLILSLGVIPCADGYAPEAGKAAKEISQQQADDHSHDSADNCSPFCTCSCCATNFSSAIYIIQLTTVERTLSGKQHTFLPAAISDISLPVWQPPQLS